MFYLEKLCESMNWFNIIHGLWLIGVISNVACVNPSPSGVYRYIDSTTPLPSQIASSEETIKPPPSPSPDVRII